MSECNRLVRSEQEVKLEKREDPKNVVVCCGEDGRLSAKLMYE